ncbi:hypothetical protein WA158_002642 [Blastocystis sp. Blastoise]
MSFLGLFSSSKYSLDSYSNSYKNIAGSPGGLVSQELDDVDEIDVGDIFNDFNTHFDDVFEKCETSDEKLNIATVLYNDCINKHSIIHRFDKEGLRVYQVYNSILYRIVFALNIIVMISLIMFEQNSLISFVPSNPIYYDYIYITIIVFGLSDWLVYYIIYSYSFIRISSITRPLFILFSSKNYRDIFLNTVRSLSSIVPLLLFFSLYIFIFSIIAYMILGHTGNMETSIASPLINKDICINIYQITPFDPICNDYFWRYDDALFQSYVILTSANFPEIMLPYYRNNRGYFFFLFLPYILIGMFFIVNLILSFIYSIYTTRNIYTLAWRRKNRMNAMKRCYQCLNINNTKYLDQSSVLLFIEKIRPDFDDTKQDIILNTIQNESYTIPFSSFQYLPELLSLYIYPSPLQTSTTTSLSPLTPKSPQYSLHSLKDSHWTSIIIYIWDYCIYHVKRFTTTIKQSLYHYISSSISNYIYNTVLVLNLMRLFFIHHLWAFTEEDLFVTIIGYVLHVYLTFHDLLSLLHFYYKRIYVLIYKENLPSIWILALHFMSLLNSFCLLLSLKTTIKSFFDILPLLLTYSIIIFIIYYIFAIFGMYIFQGKLTVDNSFVATSSYGKMSYYTLNFETIFQALLTVFTISVGNNWSVFVEGGVASYQSKYIRLYYISFYIICIYVFLNIFYSIVVSTFRARFNHYKYEQKGYVEVWETKLKHVISTLSEEKHIEYIYYDTNKTDDIFISHLFADKEQGDMAGAYGPIIKKSVNSQTIKQSVNNDMER